MPPATTTAARPRLLTGAFLLVAASTLAYFIADGVLLPTVPLYVEGPLRGNDVAVGLSVGAFSVTALFLRPWAGRLADRRGRRLLMVLGAGGFAVSVLGYVAASSVPLMVAFRLVTGAAEAFFFTGAASVINDLAPEERRGEAISFFSLALYLGIGIGPVLGEAVIHGSFVPAWVLAGGFAAVAAVLALRVPETRPQETSEGRLIHPAGVLPGSILLAGLWGMAGFFAFVPLYAPEIGLGGSRYVFILFSAIVILIRSFGARIPDRLGAVPSSRLALLTTAAGLGLMGAWRTPVGLFVSTAVSAVGVALTFPGLMTLAVRSAPAAERGAVIGTFTAFVDLTFGLGPASLGFVAEAAGYPGTFLVASAIAAVGLLLLLWRYPVRAAAVPS